MLSSANEEYVGLYELIWELNTNFPDATLAEKYGTAERGTRKLLDLGWISLYRTDPRWQRFEELDTSPRQALSDPTSWYPVKSWEPQNEGVLIVFAATEAGEQAYLEDSTGE